MNLHFLSIIPKYFIYIALVAWTAVMTGFLSNWITELKLYLSEHYKK